VTRLIIWRHGQTSWNATDRIQGHRDIDLDEVGRGQAAAAAAAIAACQPDAIVSSDLRRAMDTAAPLAAATGLPVRTDPRLRERYLGELQGLTGAQASAGWPDVTERWRRGQVVDGAGVEEIVDMVARVGDAVRDALTLVPASGRLVLVTHGGAAKYAMAELLDWPPSVGSRVAGLNNCHWSDLWRHPTRGWMLLSHNVGPMLHALVPAPAGAAAGTHSHN
jgi:broad specificity phosphatase PhoE